MDHFIYDIDTDYDSMTPAVESGLIDNCKEMNSKLQRQTRHYRKMAKVLKDHIMQHKDVLTILQA